MKHTVLKFHSKYLEKIYYIRKDDWELSEYRGHTLVKYCKVNGEYHKERKGEPLRMAHKHNLDGGLK